MVALDATPAPTNTDERKESLRERGNFGHIHLIEPDRDPEATSAAHASFLGEDSIDLVYLGIGQNGHLALNNPLVADFENPLDAKVVELELELACRRHPVDDWCLANLADVPHRATTLTMPRLLSTRRPFCVIPGQLERRAVRGALVAPISLANPATALRTHPDCTLYLDETLRWYFEKVRGILTEDRGLGEVYNRTRANASRIPASHHARSNLHDLGGVGIDGSVPVRDEKTATLFGRSRGPVRSR